MHMHKDSILLLTLDSCRYDTFMAADIPHFRGQGEIHQAKAPSYFTYASHAAMFVGFTPGVAQSRRDFLNPKFGKLFKLTGSGFTGIGSKGITVCGRSIQEGFRALGYAVLGSGAVGWFNPDTPTGKMLTMDFDDFYFPGDSWSLKRQLSWINERLADVGVRPVFLFLNVGETHVPYYHEGADWPSTDNPCIPFQESDRSQECRQRQKACLEYIDRQCAPLLDAFRDSTVVITSDHGDCWGEDGLWEHGISHDMTLTVPLIIKTSM